MIKFNGENILVTGASDGIGKAICLLLNSLGANVIGIARNESKLEQLEKEGVTFLKTLNTRQLEGKLWEIKYPRHNRIFYVLLDGDNIYLLHACKKQKGKAEKFELDKARERSKEIG